MATSKSADFQSLQHRAASGDARAQYELALRLARGDGVPADKAKAKGWLLRAAEAGLRDAQLVLQMDVLALRDTQPADLGDVNTQPAPQPAPHLRPPPPPAKKEPRPAPPRPAMKPSTGSPTHDEAQRRIDEIEAEMRALSCWTDDPPAPEVMNFTQAFAMDTMAFTQWLNWVFIPRVRQVIAEKGAFPSRSMVAVQAVREFDGWHESARLQTLLSEFDAFIEGL